ncbi:hypothetical protein ANCCAN_19469 [Ancylostoma caninum]|uniref:Uncharacterized protein n=1 Tax=Ancylostoma caninum TaxID=29170 RepID=A0A368FV45_ANCCA|nr:hypothetical protein ANCCAN_19469 [Ancylostoma caninum]
MKHFRTWAIVWPKDLRNDNDAITSTVAICKKYLEEGGKIVSVWPPVISSEVFVWKTMVELWTLLDDTLANYAGPTQFFKTASTRIEEGKIISEIGAPDFMERIAALAMPAISMTWYDDGRLARCLER